MSITEELLDLIVSAGVAGIDVRDACQLLVRHDRNLALIYAAAHIDDKGLGSKPRIAALELDYVLREEEG